MAEVTFEGLLNNWRDAALRAREAVDDLDQIQAQAHHVLLAQDGAAARAYKKALVAGIRPLEAAVEEYIGNIEQLWIPAAEVLREQERGS